MTPQEINSGKTAAIISYIVFVGPLIAMSMNAEAKNPYASFHIRQGLGLTITFISLGVIISNFESLQIATALWIFISVLMFYGIFSASSGSIKPLPLLGSLFQKFFKKL